MFFFISDPVNQRTKVTLVRTFTRPRSKCVTERKKMFHFVLIFEAGPEVGYGGGGGRRAAAGRQIYDCGNNDRRRAMSRGSSCFAKFRHTCTPPGSPIYWMRTFGSILGAFRAPAPEQPARPPANPLARLRQPTPTNLAGSERDQSTIDRRVSIWRARCSSVRAPTINLPQISRMMEVDTEAERQC